jgi:hypothetical protein
MFGLYEALRAFVAWLRERQFDSGGRRMGKPQDTIDIVDRQSVMVEVQWLIIHVDAVNHSTVVGFK